MKPGYIYLVMIALALTSCGKNNHKADAYGNFQATEVIVSSESSGRIVQFGNREGDEIRKGNVIVKTDSVQYVLKLKELSAKKTAIIARKANVKAEADVYRQQLQVLKKDMQRLNNMYADGAATQKQVDDVSGQIDVIEKQIRAVETNLVGITAEVTAIEASELQINDQLQRTRVISPVDGTILQKYAEEGEVTAPGKALFKVANLKQMELKAYVSGNQLSTVKIGQNVTVLIDGPEGKLKSYIGKVIWVSSEAEFTPKNIQTREERLSQVYAIKIIVENNGDIKINMPAEVQFSSK